MTMDTCSRAVSALVPWTQVSHTSKCCLLLQLLLSPCFTLSLLIVKSSSLEYASVKVLTEGVIKRPWPTASLREDITHSTAWDLESLGA